MTGPAGHEQAERRHHVRASGPLVAGCSDLGLRHPTNQDAFAVATRRDGRSVLALSDGVSSSPGSEAASLAAVEAARDGLTALVESGVPAAEALVAAFAAAQGAVLDVGGPAPAACTLTAAVCEPTRLTVGNVGDSRAYWIADDGPDLLLSVDDSLAEARVSFGMSREEAESSLSAHTITRWLGPDSPDSSPTLASHEPTGPGWLLLCSDGLWNYARDPEALGAIVRGFSPQAGGPAALAEALVAWAVAQGGADNITVVLRRYFG